MVRGLCLTPPKVCSRDVVNMALHPKHGIVGWVDLHCHWAALNDVRNEKSSDHTEDESNTFSPVVPQPCTQAVHW